MYYVSIHPPTSASTTIVRQQRHGTLAADRSQYVAALVGGDLGHTELPIGRINNVETSVYSVH